MTKRLLTTVVLALIILIAGCGGQPSVKPEVKKPVNPFTTENYKAELLAYFKDAEKFNISPDSGPNSSGQITARGILKESPKKQIEVSISEKNKLLDNVVLTIWLNGDNTPGNKDLAYIDKLVEKMYPEFKDNKNFIKDGISNALQNKRSRITKNDIDFQFVYVQDAGGTKGENAIIFGIEKTKPVVAASSKIEVDFSIEARADNGRVQFSGKTNLPSGMELMIALGNPNISYAAQDKVKVSNGTFTTATFSNKGSALPPGTYSLSIQSPMASVQPQSVRDVIGARGGNLTGPFVKYDEKWDDYRVFFRQTITIK